MKICSNQYGREGILHYLEGLKTKDDTLVIAETIEGFQIVSPSFSDTIQIVCWEKLGWNLYLLHSGTWREDPAIHDLYISVESFLYPLNETFYDFSMEQKHLLFFHFEEAIRSIDKWKKAYPHLTINCRTKTIGTFQVEVEISESLEQIVLYFSRPMNRWFVDVYPDRDACSHPIMDQWVKEWRNKLVYWNQQVTYFPASP